MIYWFQVLQGLSIIALWIGSGVGPFYYYNRDDFNSINPNVQNALGFGLLFSVFAGPLAALFVFLFWMEKHR